MRTIPVPLWEDVPAVVVPMHVLIFDKGFRQDSTAPFQAVPRPSYTVLLLDREYMSGEMLPALAQQHFRKTGDRFDYQLAVVRSAGQGVVYHTADGFSPKPDAVADAAVDLFQVRTQDFVDVAAEVRRFATTFTASVPPNGSRGTSSQVLRKQIILPPMPGNARGTGSLTARESGSLSIIVQQNSPLNGRAGGQPAIWRMTPPSAARWRLLIKHPSGSLEQAVNAVRCCNLLISSSILAVLGASVGLLILSTRRAQELARQQMEFVAVSHELRTPLAVIRVLRRKPRGRRRARRRTDPEIRRPGADGRPPADGDGRADSRAFLAFSPASAALR